MTRQEWLDNALKKARPLTPEQRVALAAALPVVSDEMAGHLALRRKIGMGAGLGAKPL